jgi:hypothetical protein
VTTGRPHLAGEGALVQEPAVVEGVGALDAARAFVGERAHVLDPALGCGEGGLDAARPQATSPAPTSVVAIAASRCLVLAGVRAYLGGSSLLSTGDP